MIRLIRSTENSRSKNLPTFVTFIISALWHGLYPGFFVFFIAAAFLEI
jgi:MBOAT, membrane-bound O-acyltransferase family